MKRGRKTRGIIIGDKYMQTDGLKELIKLKGINWGPNVWFLGRLMIIGFEERVDIILAK